MYWNAFKIIYFCVHTSIVLSWLYKWKYPFSAWASIINMRLQIMYKWQKCRSCCKILKRIMININYYYSFAPRAVFACIWTQLNLTKIDILDRKPITMLAPTHRNVCARFNLIHTSLLKEQINSFIESLVWNSIMGIFVSMMT